MELAKKVLHPYDIVNELDSYVNFLSEKFRPAISEVNKRNGNYQIVDNLTVGDIYRNYDLGLIDFSNINIQNFDVVIDQLRSTISVNHETIFLQEILDNTMQVYVRWVSPEFECFNESKNSFFWECDEPSSRVFEALINLYLNRIYFLIGELARNDFENYWNLLFEYHGMSSIEDFLRIEESKMPGQRRVCSYYYDLLNRVRDNFEDTWEETGIFVTRSSNNGNRVREGLRKRITESPLRRYIGMLQNKISTYYLKFTLKENRDNFLSKLKRIQSFEDLNAKLFVENNFHFADSIYTTKLKQHNLPIIKANELAIFLRMYIESNQLIDATKKDLILWLAHEFYGVKGFTYNNLKTYLERKSLSRRHQESGSMIVKSFQKKYKGEF